MDFEQSQTKTNLARAFAGECQAGARYQFIAQKAMQEGKKNIQMLFKTLAKNEMAHAKVFWDLIAKNSKEEQKNIEIKAGYPFEDGELKEMIKSASNNEKSENTTIYPSFAKIAEDEGFKEIAEKFKLIALVENDHFMVLDELYNKIKDHSLYQSAIQYEWKCGHCGHTQLSKKSFEICSLCEMDNGHVELTFLGNKKCCE